MSEWDAFPAAPAAPAPASSGWDAFPTVAAPAAPATAAPLRIDPNDARFKPAAMEAKQLLRGIPVLGPAGVERASAAVAAMTGRGTYAEELAREQQARQAYEAAHPVRSQVLQGAGGMASLGLAPEIAGGGAALAGIRGVAPMVRAGLGMAGPLRTAVPLAAASGGAIGAADALARGQSPVSGGVGGALGGAVGPVLGKGAGMALDAARGFVRPISDVPTRFLPGGPVAGVDIPARASQAGPLAGDLQTAREEQVMLKGEGVPTAKGAEAAQNAAMREAHGNLYDQLDPTGASNLIQPGTAGDAAVNDLVAQEQARAQAEVQRMAGVRGDITQAAQPPGAAAPVTPTDVGNVVSRGITRLFGAARAARTAAYQALGQVPGQFNERYLVNIGERVIRPALNDPTTVGLPRSARVYVKPDTMGQTAGALADIDHEMGQLAFTSAADRRNPRPITPEDIEEVRKILIGRQQDANSAARVSGNWQDARGVGRVIDEFDRAVTNLVNDPRAFSGDAQAYLAAQQAARQSHAQLRQTFSRQGTGDVVGPFMEKVLGRYPGQEMSPEKIVSSILGAPGRAPPEGAVPILNHLRDNVFGPNSPEWNTIQHGVVSHLTEAPAGSAALSPLEQAENVENFLGNARHAGAIFDQAQQGRMQNIATRLRAAQDVPPAAGTVERMIATLTGRTTGEPLNGEQLIKNLMGPRGDELARALNQRLANSPNLGMLKVAILKRVAEAPEGMMPWDHQKTGQSLAAFLNTPMAQELYSPQELTVMRQVAQAELRLVPVPGSTNPSGSAYTGAAMAKSMFRHLLRMIGISHGLHGYAAVEAGTAAYDRFAARRAAQRAEQLFLGRQAVAPSRLPQAVGALGAPMLALPRRSRAAQ